MMDNILAGNLMPVYAAQYARRTETDTAGVVSKGAYSNTGSAQAVYYKGGAAEKFVSDKFRSDVAAVVLHRPSDITFTIKLDDKVTINSEDFSVIYADNIGGKVMAVAVKAYR